MNRSLLLLLLISTVLTMIIWLVIFVKNESFRDLDLQSISCFVRGGYEGGNSVIGITSCPDEATHKRCMTLVSTQEMQHMTLLVRESGIMSMGGDVSNEKLVDNYIYDFNMRFTNGAEFQVNNLVVPDSSHLMRERVRSIIETLSKKNRGTTNSVGNRPGGPSPTFYN